MGEYLAALKLIVMNKHRMGAPVTAGHLVKRIVTGINSRNASKKGESLSCSIYAAAKCKVRFSLYFGPRVWTCGIIPRLVDAPGTKRFKHKMILHLDEGPVGYLAIQG